MGSSSLILVIPLAVWARRVKSAAKLINKFGLQQFVILKIKIKYNLLIVNNRA